MENWESRQFDRKQRRTCPSRKCQSSFQDGKLKKPNIIQRPVQKLYPVEANVDLQVKKEVGKKDKMMQNQEVCSNLKNELKTEEIKLELSSGRSHLQRKARIEGEIKRQYGHE